MKIIMLRSYFDNGWPFSRSTSLTVNSFFCVVRKFLPTLLFILENIVDVDDCDDDDSFPKYWLTKGDVGKSNFLPNFAETWLHTSNLSKLNSLCDKHCRALYIVSNRFLMYCWRICNKNKPSLNNIKVYKNLTYFKCR